MSTTTRTSVKRPYTKSKRVNPKEQITMKITQSDEIINIKPSEPHEMRLPIQLELSKPTVFMSKVLVETQPTEPLRTVVVRTGRYGKFVYDLTNKRILTNIKHDGNLLLYDKIDNKTIKTVILRKNNGDKYIYDLVNKTKELISIPGEEFLWD
jgi:hypothetical protein